MNLYALLLGLGLAALLQVSFLPALAVFGVAPDLPLVLVTGWALLRDTRSAALWALIAGIWLDLLAGGPFGSYTLGLLAAAYVSGLGGGTLFRGHIVLPVIMILITTIARSVVHLALLLLSGHDAPPLNITIQLWLYEAVYNATLMVLLLPALAWLNRITGQTKLSLE